MKNPYLIIIISFLAAYCSVPLFRVLAIRFKILDHPGDRKIHKAETPLLGGAAIYLGLLVGIWLTLPIPHPYHHIKSHLFCRYSSEPRSSSSWVWSMMLKG